MPEHQHAGEQAETAGRRDDQCHARAIARLRCLVPVADQQERKEAGQFPEEDQLDQIARQHDAEHRAHECEQEREEARHGIGGRHVVAGVKHDQEPDPGDERGEHPGEAIHPQAELEAEFRNPGGVVLEDPAIGDARIGCNHRPESNNSDDSRQVRFCVAGICPEQNGQAASYKRDRNDCDEKRFRRSQHLCPIATSAPISPSSYGSSDNTRARLREWRNAPMLLGPG